MKKLYLVLFISVSLGLSGQVSYVATEFKGTASGPSIVTEASDTSDKSFSIGTGEGFILLHNLPSGESTIRVVSLTGKVVKTIGLNNPQATEKIDLKNYPPGIYLINVQNKKGFQAVRKAYLR